MNPCIFDICLTIFKFLPDKSLKKCKLLNKETGSVANYFIKRKTKFFLKENAKEIPITSLKQLYFLNEMNFFILDYLTSYIISRLTKGIKRKISLDIFILYNCLKIGLLTKNVGLLSKKLGLLTET